MDERSGKKQVHAAQGVNVSFEFFPPTDPEMEQTLWQSVRRLAPLGPRFVSVTYGADGSTRDRTLEIVRRLQRDTSLVIAPHLTSIDASREDVLALATDYWASGIRHLVALRGDRNGECAPAASSGLCLRSGLELVQALASVAPFDIAVAAYPEVHPEAPSAAADIDTLRRKIAAGASRAISQFFFDDDVFLRFRDRCVAIGIAAPIVPGILPILRFSQVQRFARRCGASIPAAIADRFAGLDDDPAGRRAAGLAVALSQVERLRREGVIDFHIYTLNRADLPHAICEALGLLKVADAAAEIALS